MARAKNTCKKDIRKAATTKKPRARRWKIGQEYTLTGDGGERRLTFIGRGTLNDRELLIFHPVRAAMKVKP
jgi:hypothetical protein